jgi:hypothetical protein
MVEWTETKKVELKDFELVVQMVSLLADYLAAM